MTKESIFHLVAFTLWPTGERSSQKRLNGSAKSSPISGVQGQDRNFPHAQNGIVRFFKITPLKENTLLSHLWTMKLDTKSDFLG